jgi:hypothetical protein
MVEEAAVLMSNIDNALEQQARILAYPKPDQWDLTYMQNFLQGMDVPISSPDGLIWGKVSDRKAHSPDLITLSPRPKEDPFSGWVGEQAIKKLFCCLRLKKPSRIHGVIGYEDTSVLKITYWVSSILASLLLVASITVLYCIHSMPARLGVIGAFNVMMSLCLIAFTNATRTETFAIPTASASPTLYSRSSD